MAEVIEKDEVAQAGDDDEQEALQSRHRKEKKELQGFSTWFICAFSCKLYDCLHFFDIYK